MRQLQQVIVDLRIDAEEYLKYYRGQARFVSCRARDGRTLRFPVGILNRFITRDGLAGSFKICFDQQGKFVSIERES